MMRIVILAVAAVLFALSVQAGPPELRANLEELRARLVLTPEQEARVKSILEEHFKTQTATLEKHNTSGDVIDLQRMRVLREEFRANKAKVESRLSGVLSEAQMAAFRRIRAEQNEKLRKRILAKRLDEIGARLGLTPEQAERIRPVLKKHFEAQMAALDRHGIGAGTRDGGRRPGFRALRRLRGELRGNNAATLKRLSAILSKARLAAYEALQAEQREKLRALLRRR